MGRYLCGRAIESKIVVNDSRTTYNNVRVTL